MNIQQNAGKQIYKFVIPGKNGGVFINTSLNLTAYNKEILDNYYNKLSQNTKVIQEMSEKFASADFLTEEQEKELNLTAQKMEFELSAAFDKLNFLIVKLDEKSHETLKETGISEKMTAKAKELLEKQDLITLKKLFEALNFFEEQEPGYFDFLLYGDDPTGEMEENGIKMYPNLNAYINTFINKMVESYVSHLAGLLKRQKIKR